MQAIKDAVPKERPTFTYEISEICDKSGLTDEQISQALQELENQGLITLDFADNKLKRISVSTLVN